jgi:hypothetical protein
VIKKILRALATRAASQPGTAPDDFSNRPYYRWRCECGAKSRYSDIKADTEYNAQRHRMRQGVEHQPEVYPAE